MKIRFRWYFRTFSANFGKIHTLSWHTMGQSLEEISGGNFRCSLFGGCPGRCRGNFRIRM